tara:strand:+ start:1040 stop:2818 length:1779 start_codon:yes stop_codon:yes gene_type:complete
MISAFQVELQKFGDSISPSDYGKRAELISAEAERLKTQYLSFASREGWRPDNASDFEKALTSQAAQAEINALKTAKNQEVSWHRNNITNVIDEQLRRTETLGFEDGGRLVETAGQTIRQSINAASGVLSAAELDGYLNGPQGWFVQKENQYMEHLVEQDPERMLDYTAKFSLRGEAFRKQARGILSSRAGKANSAFKAQVDNMGTSIKNLASSLSIASDSQWNEENWVRGAYEDIDAHLAAINQMLQSQPMIDARDFNKLTNFTSDLRALRIANRWAEQIVLTNKEDRLDEIMSSFEEYAGSEEIRNAPGRTATALKGQQERLTKLVTERKALINSGEEMKGRLDAMVDSVGSFSVIGTLKTTGDLAAHRKGLEALSEQLQVELKLDRSGDPDARHMKSFLASRIALIQREIQATNDRAQGLQDARDVVLIYDGTFTGGDAEKEAVLQRTLSRNDRFGETYGSKMAQQLLTPEGLSGPISTEVFNIVKNAGFVPAQVANVIDRHLYELNVESSDADKIAMSHLIQFVKLLQRTNRAAVVRAFSENIQDIATAANSEDLLRGLEWANSYLNRSEKTPPNRAAVIEDLQNYMGN